MNFFNIIGKVLFLSGVAVFAAGCSSSPPVQDFASTASPSGEIDRLAADLKTASDNQVDALSPKNFKNAQDSLRDAKASLDAQKDPQRTLHLVAEGRAYLDRSNKVAKVSHANLEEVISARGRAVAAGAAKLNAKDLAQADESLSEATADLANNDIAGATKIGGPLQLTYLDIELRSIKETNLGPARSTIALAKKQGAAKFAPQSLAIAEKSVADADAYINGNPHDTAQITARANTARQNADHLLKITRSSQADKKTSPEQLALQMESEQNKTLATQQNLGEKEDQLAKEQGANQALAVENSQNQNDAALAAGAAAALASQNAKLQSEQDFNRKYEEARAQFTKSEAEVYKQGNTLVIRLRGLEFPTAKSVLKGADFALLAKVETAIKSMHSNSVVVEGHTDSTGGKALNERLSTDRANAVKEYLAANTDGAPVKIEAVGYGDEKPLASNKTSSGRAQNRRVDVFIHPDMANATATN